MDKLKAWSEAHDSADDSVRSLGSDVDAGEAEARIVKKGIVVNGDCTHCLRQTKSIILWPEIMSYYMRRALPNAAYRPDGVMTNLACACGKYTQLFLDWDEVRRYVENGVRRGALPPQLLGRPQQRR